MFSIKRELNRNLILLLITLLLMLFAGLGITAKYILQTYALNHLQHDTEALIRALSLVDKDEWQLDYSAIPNIYNTVHSGHYYQIQVPTGLIDSRSVFDQVIEPPRPQKNLSMSYGTETPDDQDLLVLQTKAEILGQEIIFWVAEDMTFVYHTLWNYLIIASVIAVLLIAILSKIQRRILNRSFRVFTQLQENIQRLTDDDLTLDEANVPVEVEPLVNQIQGLVQQLRQRNERTRRAIGDLSHELKRPLQLLTLIAQENRSTQSMEPLKDIHQIIDRELRRARIAGSRHVGGKFSPRTELMDLVIVMKKIYPEKHFELSSETQTSAINFDRDDLLELFGNLIDNAAKFSHSKILIHCATDSGKLFCRVEDDGPGVPESQYEHVLRPGIRLDESVNGHGIGLRICRDIVYGYSGKLTFTRSDLGGLAVMISLPYSTV